ncbi:TPA: hypothetical protein QDA82_006770 [Burkholderia vietnamiensis]|nr:hypothetical protein [Burkholderia vietnamiensis]HDR8956320.1 hypothetical protein [Burkholderia vietnamiensis]
MPASSGNPINSFLRRSEWGTVWSGGLGQGKGRDTLETSKRVTRIEYHVAPADDHARFEYIVAERRGIFAGQRRCLRSTFEPLGFLAGLRHPGIDYGLEEQKKRLPDMGQARLKALGQKSRANEPPLESRIARAIAARPDSIAALRLR